MQSKIFNIKMKIKLLSLLFFITLSFSAYSQKSISNEYPDNLFNQGKEMFLDKNYVGAQNTLTQYLRVAKDRQLISEADYMIAASDYFRGKENSIEILRDHLDKYPETYHRNEISFYVGSSYFSQKDWNKALFWFDQTDVDYLNYADQEDFTFRSSYANLQSGKRAEAARGFEMLTRNSDKYYEAATYYKAYIDFQDEKYDQAVSVFERLKNNPEYAEQSYFFITQSLFLKNDLAAAINAGQDYLNKYPDNNNSAEIYRILGNSYFRTNNIQQSISNYEKYLSREKRPFREDMYQLGTAYSQIGDPQKSIHALQFSASKDDQLGQAAYMLLGQNYLKTGDNTNALMAFDAASRANFDPSIKEVALYNYAMLVHKTSLSVFDQSITVLQRFLQEYPNSRYVEEINNQLASTLLSTNNYQAALNVINQMRSPGRQILEAKQAILFQLGAQDFIDGDYRQAIEQFTESALMGNYDIKTRNEAYFWRAESFYRLNNNRTAISDYQNYITASNPSAENYAVALYNLGYSFFNLKEYNNALSRFREYVSHEKDKNSLRYSDAFNRMGDCYLYNRNFTEAERMYAQASQANNQAAEYADFQRAFVLGLTHNYNGKVSALDAMMRKYSQSQYFDDALYEKGRALIMMGREQDAIAVLSQLVRDYPESNIAPQAGVLLGQSYYNTNNTNQAIQIYKNVAQTYKNTESARMAIQSLEGIYRDINDISSYANFVNSLGSGIVVTASRQDSLTYLAAENVYMKVHNADAANAMSNYLRSYPNGSFAGDAHFAIGTIAYESKNYDKALDEFNRAISAGNARNAAKALALVGEMQYERGNVQESYDAFKQLERIAVNADERSIGQAGILKTSRNNPNEMIQAANQLLANDKTTPEIRNQAFLYRAKAYLETGDTNKAQTDLTEAAKDTRSVYGAEAQYLLAETYYKNRSYDSAERQVIDFMKQNTPHAYWMARAIIVLADTYQAKGDNFQAKQYLESLDANYTGDEADIRDMIKSRLDALK